jgi:hypothetical protein
MLDSEYTKVFFPVVLFGAVGGVLGLATEGRVPPEKAAAAGASLGAVVGIMQAEKRSAEMKVEVEEVLGALGVADVAVESAHTSRNVIIGAVALFAIYHFYERMSGQGFAFS